MENPGIRYEPDTHRYFDDRGVEYPSVTRILQEEGFIDSSWFSTDDAERGQQVHRLTAEIDHGLAPELIPGLEGYITAYLGFVQMSGFKPQLIEHPFIHLRYGYAGTLDRTGMMGSREIILDLKTGGLQPWHGLQLAAYLEGVGDGKRRDRFSLYLQKTGAWRLHEWKDRSDLQVFLSAAAVHNWKKQHRPALGVGKAAWL